jgi:general secretion pathway protein A
MKGQGITIATLFTALTMIGMAPAPALANPDTVETGRLLAILLESGRVVIGANQSLINDPAKGDKGFTPDVFETQLIEEFKVRSGVDLANLQTAKVPEMAKKLLPELVAASKQTVDKNQPVINWNFRSDILNTQGVGFKGFTPAHFGTQVAAEFSAKTGVYLKQTTTDQLLRNPNNKADDFEMAVLKKFGDASYPRQGEKIISETVEGGKALRVMLPLFYGKACLSCHGEPKGQMDISGYKKEGAKEGDLGGAISVKLPLK